MQIDFRNMFSPRLGGTGLNKRDVDVLEERLKEVKAQFLADKNKGKIDFTKLPDISEETLGELAKAEEFVKGYDTVVVIGIGGSDLGARAVHEALNHSYHNQLDGDKRNARRVYFAGDTTDPTELVELAEVLDLSKTVFLIVSKSGNTIEPASVFLFFRERVVEALGAEASKEHFLFITDPESGTLRALANKEGYAAVIHPPVGGRYSVLSSVGMVPAGLAGLDVEKFLDGARDIAKELDEAKSVENDFALKYAALLYLQMQQGKSITVMVPYVYSLRGFALWFRQLWAESLGNKYTLEGELVNTGLTPVASIGPTDQHSQLQLYNEGPNDKVYTFINTVEPKHVANLPEDYTGVEDFAYLKGNSFHDVLTKEMETTIYAISKNSKPNCTITLSKLDEYNLAQLFYFYEQVTAYMGYLMNVNPYDQPGVELSKNAMYGVLGKEGYENEREVFERFLES